MASKKQLFFALLLLICSYARGQEVAAQERSLDDTPASTNELSPAEELMLAAQLAGYNMTLDVLDLASNKTDEEVLEMMPAPVAEKFISHRRRDGMDLIREQMIGMIFTGAPLPLGSNLKRRPNRQRNNFRPNKNPQSFHRDFNFNPQGESSIQSSRKIVAPNTILKPMSYVPGPTQVHFPSHMSGGPPSGLAHHPNHRPDNRPDHRPDHRPDNRPDHRPDHRPDNRPDHRPRPPQRPPQHEIRRPPPPQQRPSRPQQNDNQRLQRPQHGGDFVRPINDNFGNTIGPDFGPVTFEDFGGFHNEFEQDFDFKNPNPPAPKPAPTKIPSRPSRPSRPRPSRPSPSRPSQSSRPATSFNSGGFGGFSSNEGSCVKYTDDICLDTNNYPHEAILSSLAGDPSRADTMIAEVRSQSADDLVDGLSASQESRYNYDHYYGSENRRAGAALKEDHRDFAEDGGYLCPSEVKYARPKRARNSKGSWKYIVNMEKYSQTIRMEKCMKPGGTCSYVSHHYRAQCNQIYNYHRLLSWEKNRGLHMDIFKVPSCCSCHIQGYAYVFPPLNRQSPAGSEINRQSSSGSVVNERIVPSPEVNDVSPKMSSEKSEDGDSYVSSREPSQPSNTQRTSEIQTQRVEDQEDQGGYRPRSDSDGINRSSGPNAEDRKVNYGYHPIIDFFSPYRLKAH